MYTRCICSPRGTCQGCSRGGRNLYDTTTHHVFEYVLKYKNKSGSFSFHEIDLCDPGTNHSELLRIEFMKKYSSQDIEIEIKEGVFKEYFFDPEHPDRKENDFISMTGNGACATFDELSACMMYTSKYPILAQSMTFYTVFHISYKPYGIQIQIYSIIIHFCCLYIKKPVRFHVIINCRL